MIGPAPEHLQRQVEDLEARVAQHERNLDEMGATQNALITERDQARADLAAAIEDRERLRGELESRAVVSQERLQLEGLSLDRVLAIRAQRDRLRAELEATQARLAELQTLAQGAAGLNATVDRTTALIAERDRLRAVLNPGAEATADLAETLATLLAGADTPLVGVVDEFMAALRTRAGEETTPTSPPLQDLGRWQCSGCHWVFKMPWQRVCPACQRRDYWTASVAPDGAVWPARPTP